MVSKEKRMYNLDKKRSQFRLEQQARKDKEEENGKNRQDQQTTDK
jgi:hypothetical protein